MRDDLARWLIDTTGARAVGRVEQIQSLWGGYGDLLRVHLVGAPSPSVVMKWVRPPVGRAGSGVSHERKRRSYQVETTFYRAYAPRCPPGSRVPGLVGARERDGESILVLEDLDVAGFGGRSRDPRGEELEACLAWLAHFHARFLGVEPQGLWVEGTYWHLQTRQEELGATRDPAVRARAPALDAALRGARHRTLVHGDAKPANFCFDRRGRRVAAVDFQYVGGGVGVRDLSYLLHGAAAGALEARSVDLYFERLRAEVEPGVDVDAVEAEWRGLYPVATQDFERFLAGWRG